MPADPLRTGPMHPPAPRTRRLGAALALGLGAAAAHAFEAEALNDAQALIYETPHLASTEAGDELGYAWTARAGDAAAETDRATLTVAAAHADGTRDVTLDFLSGERRLELPDFDGWRANPVLLAAFERFAQDFASDAGSGALYFRNRMRDALADAPTTEAVTLDYGGRSVEATRIEFAPFANDPYVGARPAFARAVVRLELSEAVPGGVLSAAVESGAGEAGAGAPGAYRRELRLEEAAR